MKMNMDGFFESVYSVVSQIPAGFVMTYGQIAALIGFAGRARRVGFAVSIAPAGIPCHRVVNSLGIINSAVFGEGIQRALLESEGVTFTASGHINMKKHVFRCA